MATKARSNRTGTSKPTNPRNRTPVAGRPGAEETTGDAATLKDVRDLFEMQYTYAQTFFTEYEHDVKLYEQIVDPAYQDTTSEITLGTVYALVQDLMPAVMYYTLWAPETPFEAIPRDHRTTYETARKVRDNLIYTQRERMDLEMQGWYAILTALKLGVGYTLVEPKEIQDQDYAIDMAAAGGMFATSRSMAPGLPQTITGARNLGVGQVFPTPDGAEPSEVSAITVLDYISEWNLKLMYERTGHPYRHDAEKIINYAKSHVMNGWAATTRQIAARLAGHSQTPTQQMNDAAKNMPALIPVLKQYRPNRHIWVAADEFVMFDTADTSESLIKPVAKATFSPEPGQWFTQGIVGRSFDAATALEEWTNAMTDLLSLTLHPHKIVNINSLVEEDQQEDIVPYGVSRAYGKPGDAIDFVRYPQMPPQAFEVPNVLRGFINDLIGAPPSTTSGATPGIVRGGTGALESLLQVSTGRQKATAKHIENGWYKQICLLTLIFNQMLVGDKDSYTQLVTAGEGNEPTNGRRGGEKYFQIHSVTRDEIRQQWRLEFNFREKLRNFVAETQQRLQVYQELIKSDRVNPDEALNYLVGDEYAMNRLRRGADRNQRRAELATMAGGAGGGRPAGGAGPGAIPATAGRGIGMVTG